MTALRGAYRFTPAQAAIFIAARQPVFHTGERQHDHAAGGGVISAPDAREPRSARNGHGPCGAAMRSASMLAPLAPPAVNVIFSTLL
ncbi:MAG: hypothetical protein DBY37_02610 [Desulfovibrionaceae bacterium]|nr:MAG: hypothetical protein DBY37_02610 [Desulfovibrionaceae bacterium]